MNDYSELSRDELARRLADIELRLHRLEAASRPAAATTPPPVYVAPPSQAANSLDALMQSQSSVPSLDELQASLAPEVPEAPPVAAAEIPAPTEVLAEAVEECYAEEPAAPTISLEQQIGQKWMLLAGLAVMLLGGLFFFKFAYDRGWIPTPPVRCIIGVIWSFAMLVLGEVVYRKGKLAFAAGLFAVSIVLQYFICWVASPNGLYYPEYDMLSTNGAFAAMCGVTLLGVLLALRANFLPGAMLTMVGALATPVMLSTGNNHQVELMSYLLVVNTGYLAVAMWKRWPGLVQLCLVGTGVIFAGWFVKYSDQSPVALTAGFAWAFVALSYTCAVIGVRGGRLTQSFSRTIVCMATVANGLVWLGLDWPATAYLSNLAAGAVALYAMSLLLRWNTLAHLSLFWGIGGVAMSMAQFTPVASWQIGSVVHSPLECVLKSHVWMFSIGLTLWYMAIANVGPWRVCTRWTQRQVTLAACAVTLLWMGLQLPEATLLWSMVGLVTVSLSLGFWRRWDFVRPAMLSAVLLALMVQWHTQNPKDAWTLAGHTIGLWTAVIWVFFALFSGELLLRTRRGKPEGDWAILDGVMILVASLGWFVSTLVMLYWDYESRMGGYSLICMAICFMLAWDHAKRLRYVLAGRMYLLAGLAMLLTAVPMQFSNWATTLGWILLGLALAWAAKRTKSITILAAPLAAILLAVVHFGAWEIPHDPPMRDVALTAFGVSVNYLLVMGAGLAAACLAMGAYLDFGERLLPREAHVTICGALPVLAGLLLAVVAMAYLPMMAATYWLVAGALVALALGATLRLSYISAVGLLLVSLAVVKFVGADTLYLRTQRGLNLDWPVLANWQVLLGAILIATLTVAIPRLLKRMALPGVRPGAFLLTAAILLVWLGSFEVDRYVNLNDWIDDPRKATHMGLSLWWAFVATVFLVSGFVLKRANVRYVAIALFGITLAKVFLVDMQGIDAAYRVLSFMGLGALLVGGSWLYHRSYKSGANAQPAEQDTTGK